MALPLPHHPSPRPLGPLAELADSVTEVPLVDGTGTRFVNFDYAASAPPLASVHRVVTTTLAYYASIHRGQSYLSRLSTAAYERARGVISQLTGAGEDDVTIFTRNTTDALNLLQSATRGASCTSTSSTTRTSCRGVAAYRARCRRRPASPARWRPWSSSSNTSTPRW